ncbi:MAG: tetraacyldisaccharide 4'-kinase [Prevotellaceae bacterium]|jgi:tetraacyldisaccharide 4'-kinase|nr:tetraacyldisaccharide 4'-kinase [Prevotellaceae bacterium]
MSQPALPHIKYALYPLAWLYGLGVWVRGKLFDRGVLRSERFDIPIVCVGNLSLGGTGKTPHTEYLVALLRNHGLNVAVLSRGYRRKTRGYLLADDTTTARDIGDEPFQIRQKFPDIRVAVDEKRVRGIRRLMQLDTPPVDVILLDDAFQHRYVRAGLNILLTDFSQPFTRDALLPAGRLREPRSGCKRADIVVVTKCPRDCRRSCSELMKRQLALQPAQELYFSTIRYNLLRPLFGGNERSLASFSEDAHIVLLTGIASYTLLQKELERYTPFVTLCTFADHHDFTAGELHRVKRIFNRIDSNEKLIITTEKDAARLTGHPAFPTHLKPYIYVLAIDVEFLLDQQDKFNQHIIHYVTSNPRNGRLPEA